VAKGLLTLLFLQGRATCFQVLQSGAGLICSAASNFVFAASLMVFEELASIFAVAANVSDILTISLSPAMAILTNKPVLDKELRRLLGVRR
jgi:hypothetical protein